MSIPSLFHWTLQRSFAHEQAMAAKNKSLDGLMAYNPDSAANGISMCHVQESTLLTSTRIAAQVGRLPVDQSQLMPISVMRWMNVSMGQTCLWPTGRPRHDHTGSVSSVLRSLQTLPPSRRSTTSTGDADRLKQRPRAIITTDEGFLFTYYHM